jgi:hypothetical protein
LFPIIFFSSIGFVDKE